MFYYLTLSFKLPFIVEHYLERLNLSVSSGVGKYSATLQSHDTTVHVKTGHRQKIEPGRLNAHLPRSRSIR